jgi:hypothetical protein
LSYSLHIIFYSFLVLFFNTAFAESDDSDSKHDKFVQAPAANTNKPPTNKSVETETTAPESVASEPTIGQQTENTPRAPMDLNSYIFNLDPSLNISLGLEINKGDIFLIIEMDHNPTRSEFTFRYDVLVPGFKAAIVNLENQQFGFHNKPVARLPMIELEPSTTSSAKFIIGSETHRTYQRVNLSKVLRELFNSGLLLDENALLHNVSDIMEIAILTNRPISQDSNIRTMNEVRILPGKYSENKVYQIFGDQILADISEQAEYQVGDQIKLKPNYKIPHRSSDTQWIILPENSNEDFLVYQLIANPKVGDLYTIPAIAEGMERVLPKLKQGYVWVKLSQDENSITYSLAQTNAILSPSILLRYIRSMIIAVTAAEEKKSDPIPLIKEHILKIPIKFQQDRLENLFKTIETSTSVEEMVRALMIEQYYFPNIEIAPTTSVNQCAGYLNL